MLLFSVSFASINANEIESSAPVYKTANVYQNERIISGTIVDSNGEPIIGAAISFNSSGTISDFDGKFKLSIPDGEVKLVVSYLGYSDKTVVIKGGQTEVTVIMEENAELLDEVVVVAFGTKKKATVTGAISMVQTKELTQSAQANVSNMLVGRMPGLLAVQRSGEPGEDMSTLRIRGVGTFADGDGTQDPLIMVDGIETTNFNNIDPNEIESLSILKDASSTAVYGVRGANGVIIITTKRGVEGKPKISYSGNVSVNMFTDIRESMNAAEYVNSFNTARQYDAYITGGYTPKFTPEEVAMYESGEDPIFYPDVDWFDLMLKDYSFNTQHNINISGGDKKVKYFVSLGYYNQQGLFDNTDLLEGYNVQSAYERFNFRSNLDFNITKDLSVKVNLSSQMETRTGNAGNTSSLMNALTTANPISTPGIVDGKIVNLGSSSTNPLTQFYQNGQRDDYRNHLNGSVQIKYNLPWVEGLSLSGTYSYENYYSHLQKYVKNPPMTYSVFRDDSGELFFQPQTTEKPFSFSESFGKSRRTYMEFAINYAKEFAGAHNVTALLLYNQSRKVDPDLAYKVPNSYQGLVGRVTYDYKDRYLAEVNIGYNGTENFAVGKRFGFFPAYSLGWVVSEEPFFPKNNIVTFLKIRGSYGEVGNDRIGNERFLYMPTAYVTAGGNYHFGNVNSNYTSYSLVKEGKIGNPDVTWEKAKKTNIGAEISLWDSKIRLSGDYFIENRDNILAERLSYPLVFGGQPSAMNMGKMKNSGVEADLTFRDSFNKFNYWLRGNITYAHNEIIFMDEVKSPYEYQYKTGQSYGQYFGLICDGIYNTWEEVNDPNRPKSSYQNDMLQPGDLIYRDINGDGIIDSYDQVPIGYSNFPEIIYGFSFGLDWKGFDLSVLFQGATHVSLQYSRLYTRGFQENFSAPRYLLNSWTYEKYINGEQIDFPHLSEGDSYQKHNYQPSTFWTRDASYLRLKNIELGYTFTSDMLKKIKMSSARIFVNATNLFTWSGMLKGVDPEAAQQSTNYEPYPITKVINVGVNLQF